MTDEILQGWDTDSSSGLLGDFDGTIIESRWEKSNRENTPDRLELTWLVRVDAVEPPDREIPDYIEEQGGNLLRYSCGNDWYSDDRRHASHVKGKVKFHANSAVGKIINTMMGQLVGYGPDTVETLTNESPKISGMVEAVKNLAERGCHDQRDAEAYLGMKFRFRELQMTYGDLKDDAGNALKPTRPYPVAYLGYEDFTGGASNVSANTQAAATAITNVMEGTGSGDVLEARVKALGGTDEHVEIIRAALVQNEQFTPGFINAVATNSDLMQASGELVAAVTDQNQIWALRGVVVGA